MHWAEITGEEAYLQKAKQSLAYFGQIIRRSPASSVMLQALALVLAS